MEVDAGTTASRDKSSRTRTVIALGIWLLAACAVIHTACGTLLDPDIWGHLRFGQDILHTHNLRPVDVYSYTGSYWIDDEWLCEVPFAIAMMLGGWTGLVVIKSAIALAILGLIFYWIRRTRMDVFGQSIFLLATTFLIGPTTATVRAQLFTCLGLAALLTVLRLAETRRGWLWFTPLIFVCWANAHGGFLAGLATVGAWAGLDALSCSIKTKRFVFRRFAINALVVLACLLATFVNPWGPELLAFLAKTTSVPRPDITEWAPIRFTDILGWLYAAFLFIGLGSSASYRNKENWMWQALWLLFAFLPLIASRHLQLFAIATPILLAEPIGTLWCQRKQSQRSPNQVEAAIVLTCSLGLSGWLLVDTVLSAQKMQLVPEFSLPLNAVSLLKQAHASGNMITEFDWGEYIIWHLGPQIKVSNDGRRDTVYSEATRQMTWAFKNGLPGWDALLKNYHTDVVLISKNTAAYKLMQAQPDWKLVYADNDSALFVPNTSPLAQQIPQLVRKQQTALKPSLF